MNQILIDPLVKFLLTIIASLIGYAVVIMTYYFRRFDNKLDRQEQRFEEGEKRFDKLEVRVGKLEAVCHTRRKEDHCG